MPEVHGITANTTKRYLVDEGAVYLDYGEGTELLLGATRGGNRFMVEQEVREMEVAGAKGPVKGGSRVVRSVPKIVANMLEITTEAIKRSLPGADVDAITNYDKITRDREIALSDHLVNVALVGRVSGSANPAIFIIKNPLGGEGGLTIQMSDKDEGVIEITFTGHYDPTDMDTEPWEIRYPDDV